MLVGVLAAGGAVGAVVALGGEDQQPRARPIEKPPPPADVTLVAGTLAMESAGPTVVFDEAIRDAVMAAIEQYLAVGIVSALREGTASDTELAAAFDDGAMARLAGPDRTIVLDEGLPEARGKLAVTVQPVTLTGLADANGATVIVTAALDLSVSTRTMTGEVAIARTGDLVLAPGADGVWRVTAYALHVERSGKGLTPPTTRGRRRR